MDAFLEPVIVFSILTAGVIFNRRRSTIVRDQRDGSWSPSSTSSSEGLLSGPVVEAQWRERKFLGKKVRSRNTIRWKNSFVSRILRKFPFLVEVWYWLLVYWTYQLARAFSAVTLQTDTVVAAREHALSLIRLEQRLNIFLEPAIQAYFLPRPTMLKTINMIYSFIHIPGTITFLAWLYHYAPTSLFEARRRTLAVCNLMAFVVFTAWPCMPPRLLPEEDGFSFVDTVHAGKVASVWTTNKFCNQLAAMPSLHFGYSFVIGLTIATMPPTSSLHVNKLRRRIMLVVAGMAYPTIILVAILATANHYILDAVAGFFVALIGWHINGILLNLLVIEDWAFYFLRVHKPAREADLDGAQIVIDKGDDEEDWWRKA
ncbi:uncharacterized protein LAJ45_07689 [Morchella importuna]|uniref:Inositolphosphotransferase Aur1/Ipt1 domain-containing protein n=1 Tax=Morchella conica CCBAS932 TaxID=1392247 RepID=A0A3N4KI16_9PEZI|nr:uncharacterized protein LAJ45_07689 [Morchella importuna]KAH8148237.1 hypothetical protein LAJ45_07689 [Morchella importuna]RPB10194.1 hypothetical protein P167DRAFT_277985 [Morchella conica CCBAS932]